MLPHNEVRVRRSYTHSNPQRNPLEIRQDYYSPNNTWDVEKFFYRTTQPTQRRTRSAVKVDSNPSPPPSNDPPPFLSEAALRQMDAWVKQTEGTSVTDFQSMRAAAFVHEQALAASQPKLPPGYGIPSPNSRSGSPPAPVPPNLEPLPTDTSAAAGGVGLSSDLLSANINTTASIPRSAAGPNVSTGAVGGATGGRAAPSAPQSPVTGTTSHIRTRSASAGVAGGLGSQMPNVGPDRDRDRDRGTMATDRGDRERDRAADRSGVGGAGVDRSADVSGFTDRVTADADRSRRYGGDAASGGDRDRTYERRKPTEPSSPVDATGTATARGRGGDTARGTRDGPGAAPPPLHALESGDRSNAAPSRRLDSGGAISPGGAGPANPRTRSASAGPLAGVSAVSPTSVGDADRRRRQPAVGTTPAGESGDHRRAEPTSPVGGGGGGGGDTNRSLHRAAAEPQRSQKHGPAPPPRNPTSPTDAPHTSRPTTSAPHSPAVPSGNPRTRSASAGPTTGLLDADRSRRTAAAGAGADEASRRRAAEPAGADGERARRVGSVPAGGSGGAGGALTSASTEADRRKKIDMERKRLEALASAEALAKSQRPFDLQRAQKDGKFGVLFFQPKALGPFQEFHISRFDINAGAWVRSKAVFGVDTKPLMRGTMRVAYCAVEPCAAPGANGPADPAVPCASTVSGGVVSNGGGGGKPGEWVAKTYVDPSKITRAHYFTDVEMQQIAIRYAALYNQRGPPKRVQFLDAFVAETPKRGSQSGSIYCFEPFLLGDYVKHSNNYGFVSDADRNTPQAFSHFTWVASGGRLLVVDIQGVGDVYTDPQIHDVEGKRFGKGNLGMRGVAQFFSSHKCNHICRFLKLPAHGVKAVDAGTVVPGEEPMAPPAAAPGGFGNAVARRMPQGLGRVLPFGGRHAK